VIAMKTAKWLVLAFCWAFAIVCFVTGIAAAGYQPAKLVIRAVWPV